MQEQQKPNWAEFQSKVLLPMFWSSIAEQKAAKKVGSRFLVGHIKLCCPWKLRGERTIQQQKLAYFYTFASLPHLFILFCTQVKVLCKFYELIEFRSNKVDFRVLKWQFNVWFSSTLGNFFQAKKARHSCLKFQQRRSHKSFAYSRFSCW